MHFDDRLGTVLRASPDGERAMRTQFLQLLDLLGTGPFEATSPTVASAFARLDELSQDLPAPAREAVVRQVGGRIRNPALLLMLARAEPPVAAAAVAGAQLDEDSWLALIPRLPITARGFLRHRSHTPRIMQMLSQLGVHDFVLTGPSPEPLETSPEMEAPEAEPSSPEPIPFEPAPEERPDDIAAIVRRIEAFQKKRDSQPAEAEPQDPRLPLDEADQLQGRYVTSAMDFATDAGGTVIWADPNVAPMLFGMSLLAPRSASTSHADPRTMERVRRRQPIEGAAVQITGSAAIAGHWQIDAAPVFAPLSGAFDGYRGRLRRLTVVEEPDPQEEAARSQADRMRQTLHELRTPANAIQGFAEVIQQQIVGPVPHEYRALAAEVAGDAARMLAGFEEIDRYARLQTGALELEPGRCDVYAIASSSLRQIEPVLAARGASFTLDAADADFALERDARETERMVWRVAASLASALDAGEKGRCFLDRREGQAQLVWLLPASMARQDDVFTATVSGGSRSLSASMFGNAFALRLARAEARACGGRLYRDGDTLVLQLPLLTKVAVDHSERAEA